MAEAMPPEALLTQALETGDTEGLIAQLQDGDGALLEPIAHALYEAGCVEPTAAADVLER